MQRRNTMSQDKYRRFIRPSDRQPALDPGRTVQGGWCTARLKLANPEIEDAADPDIEQQKRGLEAAAQ